MDSIAPLAQRMPYTTAFPKALGTGLLISTPHPITAELRGEMERFIDDTSMRFRDSALIRWLRTSAMRSMAGISIFPIGPARYSICTTRCTPPRAVRSTRAWART